MIPLPGGETVNRPAERSIPGRRGLPALAAALLLTLAACAHGGDGGGPAPRDEGAPKKAARGELTPTMLIRGARVFDGTGAPGREVDVRVEGDRIVAVGALERQPGDRLIDGTGRALAPGFIDTHTHADDGIFAHRDALAAVSQGITTVVVGQDGGSYHPLADFFAHLKREPPAVNVASYAGHGTLREAVLKKDFKRAATDAEIEAMAGMLRQDMEAGALGLATGLEYDPGIYSTRDEVMALARVAAAAGGRYISHVRSEDRRFWDAIDEIIAIGRETGLPVQISHIKLAMRSSWGKGPELLAKLDAARASGVAITADIYPYLYWHSTLTVLFPDRDFEDRDEAAFVLREIAAPEGLLLGRFDPEPAYAGLTVAEIARRRGTDPVTTLLDLIRESEALSAKTGEATQSVIGTSMDEKDLEVLMAWSYTNFCTDGDLDGRHPRGFGSYPRVLGRYVRERGILTLEEAIRKMTSLAADNMGFKDRGRIQPGQVADLVLFDPATIIDNATPADPQRLSTGVDRVWVNGESVFDAGKPTGRLPGRVLTRK